ncbi:MAG: radical SAM protein [candidate division Zixibacteria bacterium]|nr:radical SAM protein [candidate division Zixibacteria bacterium]
MKKVLLLMPDAHMHTIKIGSISKSLREAPLTLTTLAAMIDSSRFEIKIIDESVDNVPHNYQPDIVGISTLTGTACRAYRFANYYMNKGITVVLGGPHVTILPEEASLHASSIVIGMAENIWPQLLIDFENNALKPRYEDNDRNKSVILSGVPAPRYDLQRRSGYVIPDTIQATRGCMRRCDFCSVSAIWPKFYRRPIAEVIRDIKLLPGKRIAINDVSLVDDVQYAKELFSAMIPLGKTWGGLATVQVAEDDELLDLMQASGCTYLLIGFESFNQESLRKIKKRFNQINHYHDVVQKLHDHGIMVQGTMVFGFDEDTFDVFQETIDRVQELNIDIPRYSIYTPYPGTPLYARLTEEKRIISHNWEDYDTMHVVFQPARMTVDELFNGFKWAYKETFKFGRIIKRVPPSFSIKTAINFMGNATYKLFVSRLNKDMRYISPNSYTDNRPLFY